jgi:hypothetical protein
MLTFSQTAILLIYFACDSINIIYLLSDSDLENIKHLKKNLETPHLIAENYRISILYELI